MKRLVIGVVTFGLTVKRRLFRKYFLKQTNKLKKKIKNKNIDLLDTEINAAARLPVSRITFIQKILMVMHEKYSMQIYDIQSAKKVFEHLR